MMDDWQSILDFLSDQPEPDFNLPSDKTGSEQGEPILPISRLPTPPEYVCPLQPDMEDIVFSVSTAFFLGADVDSSPSDLIIVSSDSVLFYVHSHLLRQVSENNFNSMLFGYLPAMNGPLDLPTLHIPESSAVLNVLLHTIYDVSCVQYSPPFDVLSDAVNALEHYGIPVAPCITPSSPLFTVLLSQAPLFPIEAYGLAAHYDLYDLAVQASSHLLSFSLSSLTDEMAIRIGPVYLKRLFFLHLGLVEALKRLLIASPHSHQPTEECGYNDQKQLTRAWALASAYLAWDARPDLSIGRMDATLSTLQAQMTCELCQQMLADRIKHLAAQWSLIKRTI